MLFYHVYQYQCKLIRLILVLCPELFRLHNKDPIELNHGRAKAEVASCHLGLELPWYDMNQMISNQEIVGLIPFVQDIQYYFHNFSDRMPLEDIHL